MMQDAAHKYTDKQLQVFEGHLKSVYTKAYKEIKDEIKQVSAKLNINPEMSVAQKINLMNKKDHLETLAGQIKNTLDNADNVAENYMNKMAVNVYKTNYNFEAEKFKFALIDNTSAAKILNKDVVGLFEKANFREGKIRDVHELRKALATSLLKGEGINDIAKRIKPIVERSMSDSIRIARTETTRVQNAARIDVGKHGEELGFTMMKEWVATNDDRTRDEHNEADGQQVPVNEPFIVGGEKMMYPADLSMGASAWNTINCRCTMVTFLAQNNEKLNGLEEQKTSLQKQATEIKQKMDAKNKTYSGIWKDNVTLEDWAKKSADNKELGYSSIESKKEYYTTKINSLNDTLTENPDNNWAKEQIEKFEGLQKELEDFDKQGKAFFELKGEYDNVDKQMKEVDAKINKLSGKVDDVFSQERKDNALWFKEGQQEKADDVLREGFGKVWKNATEDEKFAIYDYTGSYSKFNEPLRGIEYGTSKYKGVGKVDLNTIGENYGGMPRGAVKSEIDAMTSIIDKCETPKDMWTNRGVYYGGMDKFFGIDSELLRYGSEEDIMQALEGKVITEYGFMSTSPVKGSGFHGDIKLNIYMPKGTKAAYVEPISRFGMGAGKRWDGISKQSSFGSEFEVILQRGSQFKVTKIEKKYGHMYIDMDLIGFDKTTNY